MSPVEEKLIGVLGRYIGGILAHSVLALAVDCARADLRRLSPAQARQLVGEISRGVRLYVQGTDRQEECLEALKVALEISGAGRGAKPTETRVSIPVALESDIVTARTAGRDLCRQLGFSPAGQIKVATAISELARNIVQYAGTGSIVVAALDATPPGVEVVASDDGPGIRDLALVLSGDYVSKHGMGIGLKGVRKLMDECDIRTGPTEGTVITARKFLT
jgi:serine/threonine-protein kinase RsbT